MDRGRLTVKMGGLIYLQCTDGCLSAAGLEGERLFLRSPNMNESSDDVLPFYAITGSVFRIVPTRSSLEAAERAASSAKKSPEEAALDPSMVATESLNAHEVTYGQSFSLIHEASQLYVSVAHSQPSENDPDCVSVVLVSEESAMSTSCELIFVPRYKIRSDGDSLNRDDEVLIRSASKSSFFHVSGPRNITPKEAIALHQTFRRGGALSMLGRQDPAFEADLETPSSIADEACLREYLDEVNGCEEGGVSFALRRYDVGIDRANVQRNQLHISRSFVSSGMPLALYHREREAFLTTSVSTPRPIRDSEAMDQDGTFSAPTRKRRMDASAAAFTALSGAEGDGFDNASIISSRQQHVLQQASNINGLMDAGRGTLLPFPAFAAYDRCGAGNDDGMLASVVCPVTSHWIIEAENPMQGGPVRLGNTQYRIRHVISGKYLAVCGSAIDDYFNEVEDVSDGDSCAESDGVKPKGCASSAVSQTGDHVVRETALCLIPQPNNDRDLQRTLFSIESLFPTQCHYLIEQDCLLLKNTITGMYVSTYNTVPGPNIRLSLQWKPSMADTICTVCVPREAQRSSLFIRSQCVWLTHFRDCMQEVTSKKLRERADVKDKAAHGDTEAIAALTKWEEERANMPAIIADRMNVPDFDERLLRRKVEFHVAPHTAPPPPSVNPDYEQLYRLIGLCQRSLAELIGFCGVSEEANPLKRDGLPIHSNQKKLYDAQLYRLIFDVILSPFKVLSNAAKPVGETLEEFCRRGSASAAGEQAGQMGFGGGVRYSMWDVNPQGTHVADILASEGLMAVEEVLLPLNEEIHLLLHLAFRLLRQMTRHDSAFADGWCEYIPVFLEMDGRRLHVVDTMQEMFTDNPDLPLDAVRQVANHFIGATKTIRRGSYIDFLGAACTLKYRGFPDRQEFVCRKLVMENPHLLAHFAVKGNKLYIRPSTGGTEMECVEFFASNSDRMQVAFVENQIALMARLCYDGCPRICQEEVSKILSAEGVIIALKTLVWTGTERVGVISMLDSLRGHFIRLALQAHIIGKISNPAIQLRISTVLFGSSSLRSSTSCTYYSGIEDDAMAKTLKEVCFHILRANPYFIHRNVSRNTLIRAVIGVWRRLIAYRQYNQEEANALIPLFMRLLDGLKDVISPPSDSTVKQKSLRLKTNVETIHIIRTREMICMSMQSLLTNAMARGADEVILYLYRAYTEKGAVRCKPWIDAGCGSGSPKSVGARMVKLLSDGTAVVKNAASGAAAEAGCCGRRKRRADGYEQIGDSGEDDDDNVSETSTMKHGRFYAALVPMGVREDEDGGADGEEMMSAKHVHEYLDFLTDRMCSVLRPVRLIPLLLDVTRYNNNNLTQQAMRLMVQLSVVKRSMAQMVLQVNTLPSTEIVRSFDKIHDVAVQLLQSYEKESSFGENWDIAIETTVMTLLGSFEETATTETPVENLKDIYTTISSAEEEAQAIISVTAGSTAGMSVAERQAAERAASLKAKEKGSAVLVPKVDMKTRVSQLWSRLAGATRLMIYNNAIRKRRRGLGLSEFSKVPLHLIVRSEVMAHWRIHETLLRMLPKVPPSDETFLRLMKFFHYFTLSESNAKLLRAHINVFMSCLRVNQAASALCLHIIVAILGTMRDIDEFLTQDLLDAFATRINANVLSRVPDQEFVELLSDKVFSKKSVGVVVRRRMMLTLREHKTLRYLVNPRPHPTQVEIHFTSALVNLVCNICGADSSVLTLAQGMLPASNTCSVCLKYASEDILTDKGTAVPDVGRAEAMNLLGGFKLVNPYLRTLVALYFTADEGNKNELRRRQMQWSADQQWWLILRRFTDLMKGVSRLIKVDAGSVHNRGVNAILLYRLFFLTSVPIALAAFFMSCFSTEGYFKNTKVIGTGLRDLLETVTDFGDCLMQFKGSLSLTTEDVVTYRQMLGIVQYRAEAVRDDTLLQLARKCERSKNAMREYLAEQQHELQAALVAEEAMHERMGLRDANDEDISAFDILFKEEAVSKELQEDSGRSLIMSSAAGGSKGINIVRASLRETLKGNTVIPNITQNPSSIAYIINSLLVRATSDPKIRQSITRITSALKSLLFGPRTSVALLNLFYNALDTVLHHPKYIHACVDEIYVQGGGTEEGEDAAGGDVSPTRQSKTTLDLDDLYAGDTPGYALQVAFSDAGLMHVAVSMCAIEDDVMAYNAVRLGVMILEGGNKRVQKALYQYFITREEGFFRNMRDIIRETLTWTRQVNSEHQYYMLKRGMRGNQHRVTAASINVQLIDAMIPKKKDTPLPSQQNKSVSKLSGWARVRGSRRLKLMTTVFRLLQLFCEGHYAGLQNYIRVQHDNLHNTNIVHEIMVLMEDITVFITPANLKLLSQGFDLLTEICQGPCRPNQEALINYGVCGMCRYVLEHITSKMHAPVSERDLLNDVSVDDLSSVRYGVSTTLLSLIEGCREPDVFQRIFMQMPLTVIGNEVATTKPAALESLERNGSGAGEDREDEAEGDDNDERIESFYNWLIFLRSIRPYANESEMDQIDHIFLHCSELTPYLGSIEVSREEGLERVFFRIPQLCTSLTQDRKDSLLWSVDRTSRATKLSDFLHKSDELIFAIEQNYAFNQKLMSWTRFDVAYNAEAGRPSRCIQRCKLVYNNRIASYLFTSNIGYYDGVSMLMAVLVNCVLVLVEGGQIGGWVKLSEEQFVLLMCVIQTIVCAFIFYVEVLVGFPVHLYTLYKDKQRLQEEVATFDISMKEVYSGLTMKEIVSSFFTWFIAIFRFSLLVFAALSCLVSPYFAAFNLMLLIYKISTLRTFIAAITMNGKQLLLTAVLGVMMLYLFSIVGYLSFSNQYNPDEESPDRENCKTLMQCFIYSLSQGLRAGGGIADVMHPWSWNDPNIVSRISYDMLFYALVTVVFLNIMFGIIIDTFGQMRDEKSEKEADMHGTCFICALDSDELEKLSVNGFKTHVKNEHNMWMYLYFMHHLRRKDPNDYTGQESYVNAKIQLNSLAFFPDENCLALEASKQVSAENESDMDDDSNDDGESGPAKALMEDLKTMKENLSTCLKDMTNDATRMRGLVQQLEVASVPVASGLSPSMSRCVGGLSAARSQRTMAPGQVGSSERGSRSGKHAFSPPEGSSAVFAPQDASSLEAQIKYMQQQLKKLKEEEAGAVAVTKKRGPVEGAAEPLEASETGVFPATEKPSKK